MAHLSKTIVANWFYPVVLALFLVVGALSASSAGVAQLSQNPRFEMVMLFDVFLTLPALYWLCFHNRHGKGKLLLGLIAVVCSGLWLAGKIVPLASQQVLPQLSWLRYAGLAIVVGFEIRLAAMAVRLMWKPQAKAADLEAQGVPPLVAKLIVLEVRFWRWVFLVFRK